MWILDISINRLLILFVLTTILGAGCKENAAEDEVIYPLSNLTSNAARALPQIVDEIKSVTYFDGSEPRADGDEGLIYSDPAAPDAESALGLIGKLFRMECHDGQEDGINFCPDGVATPNNSFADSIIAQVHGCDFKLRDIYDDRDASYRECGLAPDDQELSEGGQPIYSPAGSDKFILSSENTLDCVGVQEIEGGYSSTTAYAKALDNSRFAMVVTSRELPDSETTVASNIHQIYVRQADEQAQVLAFNLVAYNGDTEGNGNSYRVLLIVNIDLHKFVIKTRGGQNSITGLGTAGYDEDGNYFDGRSAMRIIDPSSNINEAQIFCLDNSPDGSVAESQNDCDDMRESFLDTTSGSWQWVTSFLDLNEDDQNALLGIADIFDNGEFLSDSDVPASGTDGFPTSISVD